MLNKKTLWIPNRNYTMAMDGHLPRSPVSVTAAPWELEAELNVLGVVEKKTPGERLIKVAKAMAGGKFYRNGEEPEF